MNRALLLLVLVALLAVICQAQDAPYGQYYPSYRQYYYNYYQQYTNGPPTAGSILGHIGRHVRRSSHPDRYGGNHH